MIVPATGLASLLAAIYVLQVHGPRWKQERAVEALFLLGCTAVPMLLLSLLLAAAPPASTAASAAAAARLGYRYLGFAVTLAVVSAVYWTVDEYHSSFVDGVFGVDDRPLNVVDGKPEERDPDNHPKYYNFFRIVGLARAHCGGWRGLATACVVYVGATHAHGLDDGLYHTGRAVVLLLHRTAHALLNVRNNPDNKDRTSADSDATSAAVYQHFVEVFVRAFFSPLLFCSVCDNLPMLHYKGFPNYMTGFDYVNNVVFTVDLTFAVLGYALPLSCLHGAHFKSADGSAFGVVVAMLCYAPIFDMVTGRYLDYARNPPWHEWFDRLNGQRAASGWVVFRVWGAVITLLQATFAWCTVCFGLAYSNLSYRTVVTTGPYYFCRHPAYIVKILSFAMISVPWVDLRGDAGVGRALRNVLCLLLLAGLYYLRAATEERHLRAVSPEYRAYAADVDRRWADSLTWLTGVRWG